MLAYPSSFMPFFGARGDIFAGIYPKTRTRRILPDFVQKYDWRDVEWIGFVRFLTAAVLLRVACSYIVSV